MTGVDQRRPEGRTPVAPALWYVRSTTVRKTGKPSLWHVEAANVDDMICGETIDLNDGEVRARPPTRGMCPDCDQKLRERLT